MMSFSEIISALQLLALIALALGVWRIKSIPGPQGHTGPAGPRGEQGPAGHVHSIAVGSQRHEMLRDGISTGHFVEPGTPDFDEALNTPGLSVRAPDGQILKGVQ